MNRQDIKDKRKGKKIADDIKDIEISDGLGKKITKASKEMPWYKKINPIKNQNFFKRKLYRKLTDEEKQEFIEKENLIMRSINVNK